MKRFPNVKACMSMQPMGGMLSNIDYHVVDHFFGKLYILEGNLAMYGLIYVGWVDFCGRNIIVFGVSHIKKLTSFMPKFVGHAHL